MHAWLRVSIPLGRPMNSQGPLLPILYKPQRAGSDRDTVIGSDSDSVKDDAVAGQSKYANLRIGFVLLTMPKTATEGTTHANVLW